MIEGVPVGLAIRAAFVIIAMMVAAGISHVATKAHAEQPPPLPTPDMVTLSAKIDGMAEKLAATEEQLRQTRVLAAFGGAKMRGPKVLRVITCESTYLPGSYGADAYSALRRTGLCDAPELLPGPE